MREIKKGGVLLTFDDYANIDSWHNMIDVFSEFDAKVTFFINAPDEISNIQWKLLGELTERGHIVGCHGWRHEKAVDYCSTHSLKAWLKNEVFPAQKILQDKGFKSTSFAYPCSQNNQMTDDALSQYFNHSRTGSSLKEGQRFCELDEIFIPVKKIADRFLLPGRSIDRINDLSQIEGALERVARQSEIVVFYSHRIGTEEEGKNNRNLITKDNLVKIIKITKEHNLNFYTFNDLP